MPKEPNYGQCSHASATDGFMCDMCSWKERVENEVTALNRTLREQLIDTRLVTLEQWNAEIAPKLMNLTMAIDDVKITARTYRLENYFD